METTKLTFQEDPASLAFSDFRERIYSQIATRPRRRRSLMLMWMKALALLTFAVISYVSLLAIQPGLEIALGLGLAAGISILLFALNASHDAAHGSFSSHHWLNTLVLYLPFSVLGVDPEMWRTRHLKSHHKFPNIDHCDADIDENPFVRLSPHQPRRPWQRFQHWYAWFLYLIVAFHAAWIQDFNYMKRTSLANMDDWHEQTPSWIRFLLLKVPNVLLFYVMPIAFLPFTWWQILIGIAIVQGLVSLLFILPLIGTHFSTQATFPTIQDGRVGCSYVTHQVMTSVDWYPFSRIWCGLIGGLNAHAAHHLFPKVSHRHYSWISKEIADFCDETNLTHHHVDLFTAIRSHWGFLRNLARS